MRGTVSGNRGRDVLAARFGDDPEPRAYDTGIRHRERESAAAGITLNHGFGRNS